MTLRFAVKVLENAGVDDAKNSVLSLWSHVSGKSMASLLFSMDDDLSDSPYFAHFMYLLTRRASREPLQYLLGKWSFYGDEYYVSPACLIPRADTELIVDTVLAHLPKNSRIADICCGSGCIGIAVLRNSDAVCDSVDISEEALEIARKNAESLGVSSRISLHRADVTVSSPLTEKYDVIVSNPPYIRHSVVETLSPEVLCEPKIALDGGDDGLVFYRAILKNFISALKENGKFVFEIGYDQKEDIESIAETFSLSCDIKYDIENRPRAAILKRKEASPL